MEFLGVDLLGWKCLGVLNMGMLLNCPQFASVCPRGGICPLVLPLQPVTHHSCSLDGGKWCLNVVWILSSPEWCCVFPGCCIFLTVSSYLLTFFVHFSGCWGSPLSLLYIGCCWKLCFCLASFTPPGGVLWSWLVKRELCLRIVKPAFHDHGANTGSVTEHCIQWVPGPVGGFTEGVLFRRRTISVRATMRCNIISYLTNFSFTSSGSEPKTINNI